MKRVYLALGITLLCAFTVSAQEITISQRASAEQVYADGEESDELIPMNEAGVDMGYMLYQAAIAVTAEGSLLQLENVRDYAAVYAGGKFLGTMTDNRKRLALDLPPGSYTLRLFVENIGRITYGPEILDNSRGLFGQATLGGDEIEGWEMIPIRVKESKPEQLTYGDLTGDQSPAFYRGHFEVATPASTYLDTSGWGMGEVWLNGHYLGSYWEEEKQQSIQIPGDILRVGNNSVVIFDLKSNGATSLRLSDTPVFK